MMSGWLASPASGAGVVSGGVREHPLAPETLGSFLRTSTAREPPCASVHVGRRTSTRHQRDTIMIYIIKGIAAGLLARLFLQHQKLFIAAFLAVAALTVVSVALFIGLLVASGELQ